eukprot:155972-Chlamydomonas_euryale.AAC.5
MSLHDALQTLQHGEGRCMLLERPIAHGVFTTTAAAAVVADIVVGRTVEMNCTARQVTRAKHTVMTSLQLQSTRTKHGPKAKIACSSPLATMPSQHSCSTSGHRSIALAQSAAIAAVVEEAVSMPRVGVQHGLGFARGRASTLTVGALQRVAWNAIPSHSLQSTSQPSPSTMSLEKGDEKGQLKQGDRIRRSAQVTDMISVTYQCPERSGWRDGSGSKCPSVLEVW